LTSSFILCLSLISADLTKITADAFDQYIAATETGLAPRFQGDRFLGDSSDWRDRLRQGTPLVQPAKGNGIVAIPGGLIQDWTGAIFVPHSTLKQALAIVQDYDHHKDIYKPEIVDAKVRSRTGDDFQVYMRIVKSKLLVADVFNTEHEIRFTTVDPHRAYSRAYSRRIAEVSDAGKPGEHELTVGQDRGFLWRIYGYWFFEESDGGVYITCQSITLTRDLPFALKKIMGPIIRELPGEAVRNSLEQTKKAILSLPQGTATVKK
jgi:hypothetical protein